jgi:small subunit ribosomal protein S6
MTEGGSVNLYETTFIVDPQLKEEGWESVIDKYSGIITQNGSIKQVDRWGLRRLAYEINNETHGYYVHLIHESKASVPRELERQFQLDEQCLRHLTVIADNPKYIEEMNKAKARQAASEESAAQSRNQTGGGDKKDEGESAKPASETDSKPEAKDESSAESAAKTETASAEPATEEPKSDADAAKTEEQEKA